MYKNDSKFVQRSLVVSLEMLIKSKSNNQRKLKCNSSHYLCLQQKIIKGANPYPYQFLKSTFFSLLPCLALLLHSLQPSLKPHFLSISQILFLFTCIFPFAKTCNLAARIGMQALIPIGQTLLAALLMAENLQLHASWSDTTEEKCRLL